LHLYAANSGVVTAVWREEPRWARAAIKLSRYTP
jgi:hypothetical protein